MRRSSHATHGTTHTAMHSTIARAAALMLTYAFFAALLHRRREREQVEDLLPRRAASPSLGVEAKESMIVETMTLRAVQGAT